MNKKLRELLAAKKANHDAATAINDTAVDGVLAEEDEVKFDALMGAIADQEKAIAREQLLLAQASSLDATEIVTEVDGGDAGVIVGATREGLDPMGGFNSLGEFASSVFSAIMGGGVDERLSVGAAAPSTVVREAVGTDGGFLVPPSMSQEIFRLMLEEDSLIPLTDNQETEGNSMTYRNDGEVTPWGSTGIQAYWVEEAAAITASKIKPGSDEVKLHKLAALVPVSSEMLEDVSALASFLTAEGSAAIRWKANDAIINGTGAGMPLGIINSGALVTQAKETSQTADTVNAANASKMYGRWHKGTPGQRVLVSPDALNQLMVMTVGDQPIWTPPLTGFKEAPDGLLFGRPIILSDHLQTLGDLNDFIFADFGFYRTLNKVGGGIRTDVSMHLYFDADSAAFKFIFRLGGQSKMSSVITPPNSTVTRSPWVTLAARA